MRVKKVGIIVLVCLFSFFTISPTLSMAAPAGPASGGPAGSGATVGLGTLQLGIMAILGALGIAGLISVLNDDDDYSPPAHGAHH